MMGIYGQGFVHEGGGFAEIIVDNVIYTADQIRAALCAPTPPDRAMREVLEALTEALEYDQRHGDTRRTFSAVRDHMVTIRAALAAPSSAGGGDESPKRVFGAKSELDAAQISYETGLYEGESDIRAENRWRLRKALEAAARWRSIMPPAPPPASRDAEIAEALRNPTEAMIEAAAQVQIDIALGAAKEKNIPHRHDRAPNQWERESIRAAFAAAALAIVAKEGGGS